jgi:hypothetical protein
MTNPREDCKIFRGTVVNIKTMMVLSVGLILSDSLSTQYDGQVITMCINLLFLDSSFSSAKLRPGFNPRGTEKRGIEDDYCFWWLNRITRANLPYHTTLSYLLLNLRPVSRYMNR